MVIMADIVRSAKCGSSWTEAELDAYNIEVVSKSEKDFFEEEANNSLEHVSKLFLEFEYVPGEKLPKNSEKIILHLDLASRVKEGQESLVDNFAGELLKFIGFESGERLVIIRYALRLLISGTNSVAQTDVCIMDINSSSLLLIHKRIENLK